LRVRERSTLPTRKAAPGAKTTVEPAPPHGPPGATQRESAGAASVALSDGRPHEVTASHVAPARARGAKKRRSSVRE